MEPPTVTSGDVLGILFDKSLYLGIMRKAKKSKTISSGSHFIDFIYEDSDYRFPFKDVKFVVKNWDPEDEPEAPPQVVLNAAATLGIPWGDEFE